MEEFKHVVYRSNPDITPSEFLATEYMFENLPFKPIIEDQKLEAFLRLGPKTYKSQVQEFYANLQKHKTRDVLKSEIKGKPITLDAAWFVKHLGMEKSRVVLRTEIDVIENKYNPELWLPKGFIGEKQATHWPKNPRFVHFLVAHLLLSKKGSMNSASVFYHGIVQLLCNSVKINIPALIINHMTKNIYSY